MSIFGYVVIFLFLGSAAYAGISAAPWVPTRKKERRYLLEHLTVKPDQTIYDLGCGDGSMLFELASETPDARYIGYEISLLPLLIGYLRKLRHPRLYKNVSLRFGNLFKQSYQDADIVLIFLLEKAYPKLVPIFKSLDNDAMIIVEAWKLPDLIPKHVALKEGLLPFYLYQGEQFKKNI